jgi:hypothetical protein
MVAALLALAWTGDARAAAPVSDPMTPPAFSVGNGSWAYQGAHPADGDTFTATPGGWSGMGNTYAYQWQRCSAAGSGCTDVAGATSAVLVADTLFGAFLRVAVTATNPDGSTTAYSAPTAKKLADEIAHLPGGAAAVAIAGVPEEGSTLTLDPEAAYVGSLPLSSLIKWQRCNGPTGACSEVGTGRAYVLQPADVGKHMRATFDIVNGAGHARFQLTDRVGPVALNTSPPAVVDPPLVSGDAVDGGVLQTSTGEWNGARPMSFAYQWLRCDGGGCTEIAGETSSQHQAVPADVERTLRVRVTATNANGSAASESEPTGLVAPAPPSPGQPPAVAGTARDGQILSGTRGTFTGSGSMTETVAWERCDAAGEACVSIPGADADAYTQIPADIGRRLRFKVTATNAAGSASARSAATAVVQAIAPSAAELPAVSGVARDEQVLTGSVGSWTGSPEIAYARQWMRCGEASCSPIAGATGTTYTLVSADVGSTVRLRVTASNFGNAVPAQSDPTAVVAPSAPHAVASPVVSGQARDGEVLSATTGTWKGTGPLTFSVRWERCDGGCSEIATGSTYRLVAGDVGRRIRAVVVATGPGGTADAASAETDLVAAVAPAVVQAPEVTGTSRDGETLTAVTGTWSGTAPVAVTRRWERCDPDCAPVGTEATYALGPDDVGARLRVVELAANAAGEAESASALTAVVAARAPEVVTAPAVLGTARDEETLEATLGAWSGTPQIVRARQWLRCTVAADLATCEAVPGATSPSLRASDDDVGGYLRVRVTAENAAGATVAHSAAVGPVAAAAPTAVPGSSPVVTIVDDADQSAPDVGDRVRVDPGRWAGTDRAGHATTFAYRWERCDATGCVEIPGRAGQTETVTAGDAGRQLRAVVTAANPTGVATQAAPRLGVTRGGATTAAPAPAPVPAAPATGGEASLALPPGSLLTADRCATVQRTTLRAGGVTLRVPAGTSSAAAPLVATLRGKARRIVLRAGPRAVKVRKGRATLTPAVLARAQLLQLTVTPRKGKPVKAGARLTVKPCQALLTARLTGKKLTLRVDQRTPIGRVTFTLPRGLAYRGAGTVVTLPFAGGATTRLAGKPGRPVVLPSRTAAATLTLALSGKGRKGKALRFAATTDTTRLSATASIRR